MKFSFKQIITTLVLASFITVAFLSFAVMMHGPDGRMSAGCPLSVMGALLCPQNVVAVVIHHVSAYHAFLNVSLLLLVLVWLVIIVHSSLPKAPMLTRALADSPPADSSRRKIIRWLSLLENSPAR